MPGIKPVTVSRSGFAFCRFMVAALLWLAVLLWHIAPIVAVLFIMLFSALLRVQRAPLIVLWKYTAQGFFPEVNEIVDENGLLFSHIVATVFAALSLVLVAIVPLVGWIFTAAFALLQSVAACGFCSALKLYTCFTGGTCCRVGKAARKLSEHA